MTGELNGRRLAVVNWRDPWHPAAGGAERYAWELARRLAEGGARVRYVTCRAPGQRRRERIEGVELVRMGGRFTVYPLVLLWMLLRRRGFDAVIDCQNGIPFFTPWVLPRRVPVFCAIFHVHDEQFGMYFPGWLAWIGRTLEGPVARWSYRRHACTAISPTTITALRERLAWTGPVYLVPVGVTVPEAAEPAGGAEAAEGTVASGGVEAAGKVEKTGPRLVCVTRLVPHKRVELVVDLAGELRHGRPGLRIDVIGRGPEQERLAALIEERGLGDVMTLHGFVSEERKAALLAAADLHLSASRGEGWGLVVAEAAALGVPTVAYDVDGLRDAIRDGTTGWLVAEGEPLAPAVERALKELDDPERQAEVAAACRRWAGEFDWARTAERMAALLAAAIRTGSAGTRDDQAHVVPARAAEISTGAAEVSAGAPLAGGARHLVVEGPVRDELFRDPAARAAARPATMLERLLGRADTPWV